MVSKIGIAVKDLGHSQLAYDLIRSLSTIEQKDLDVVLFCQNITPITRPNLTAVMNLYDCWGYDGTIVATDLESAKIISKTPGINRRIFYVYNFEWILNPRVLYDYQQVVRDMEVVTRSDRHAAMFDSGFNKKSVATLDQMNVDELWKKLNTKNS